jgi:hypothetical protein
VTRRAWVLNLDAEDEIFAPKGYRGPLRALAARPALLDKLGGLVPAGDVVVRAPDRSGEGLAGLAWCPTPRAVAALEAAGAKGPGAPSPEALRRTLSRRFCEEVGLTLPGACFATEREAAVARIREPTPSGRWLLRRSWGFAGRGRLAVPAGPASEPTRRFIERAVREGGVVVEPWVELRGDFGMHGWLGPDGALVLGEPCESDVNQGGAWLGSRRADAGALTAAERQALEASVRLVAAALTHARYFGPFGIDAFRYVWGIETRFNARCDINSRYSMGWATGMGDRRPDLV